VCSWTFNIVQAYVHGANCALAHLQLEAVLAARGSESRPQAGRPYCVADPSPPITYSDVYLLIGVLAVTPFRAVAVQPVVMLLLSYLIDAYCLALLHYPALRRVLPVITHDIKHVRPPLFSVAGQLWCDNEDASKPVARGGLGYRGVMTTLEGLCMELLEWNEEHRDMTKGERKRYTSSVGLAERIERLGQTAMEFKD
jgi:hypothetical protein